MGGAAQSVIGTFDFVWARISARVAGLTDDEYLWEPVAGCWTLQVGPDGSTRLDGDGGGGPPPDPPRVTTIAWRIGHLAGLALGGFTDRLFGDGTLTVEGLGVPATAADVPGYLDRRYRAWRDPLAALDDEVWNRPLGPDWGPYAESTTLDLALHVLDEVIHHGAEIALLRDLYAAQRLGSRGPVTPQ